MRLREAARGCARLREAVRGCSPEAASARGCARLRGYLVVVGGEDGEGHREAEGEQLVGLVEYEDAQAFTQPVDPIVGQVVVQTAGGRDQDGGWRIEQPIDLRAHLKGPDDIPGNSKIVRWGVKVH